MKKKLLVSMFAIAVALPLSSVVAMSSEEIEARHAEREKRIEERKEARDARIEAKQERKENRLEKRCEKIQNNIDTRIKRYENNGQMFETVFGNMIARIQRLIDRLKAKNVDVSKLETDFATLKEKVNKLLADQESFMGTLESAAEITCSEVDQENSTETKTKMGEARKVFQTLRQDRIDIREFFKSTIKPDIMEIRKKLAEQKTETELSSDATL